MINYISQTIKFSIKDDLSKYELHCRKNEVFY